MGLTILPLFIHTPMKTGLFLFFNSSQSCISKCGNSTAEHKNGKKFNKTLNTTISKENYADIQFYFGQTAHVNELVHTRIII